ncbi:type II pantothenate kinase, partial [Paenibacillus sepulcri]|nr:type II pantothenate kinase [Paenibacillus sepulcri]
MMNIGIDAGGTLIKVAWMKNGSPEFKKFPVARMEVAAAWINELGNARICMTGGKAALLQSKINQKAAEMVEFEATCSGVRFLLARNAISEES